MVWTDGDTYQSPIRDVMGTPGDAPDTDVIKRRLSFSAALAQSQAASSAAASTRTTSTSAAAPASGWHIPAASLQVKTAAWEKPKHSLTKASLRSTFQTSGNATDAAPLPFGSPYRKRLRRPGTGGVCHPACHLLLTTAHHLPASLMVYHSKLRGASVGAIKSGYVTVSLQVKLCV